MSSSLDDDTLISALQAAEQQEDATDPALTIPPHTPTQPVSVAEPVQPASTTKDTFSVLSRVPADIAHVRQRLFELEEPVEFSAVDWEKYWP